MRLLAYGIPLQRIKNAVQRSNLDVGGRVIEMSETEYMVRGLGYLGTLTDAEIEDARVRLRGYLLVAQDRTWIEYWSRQDGGRWLVTELDDPAATLDLSEIGCKLPLAEIYEEVELTS